MLDEIEDEAPSNISKKPDQISKLKDVNAKYVKLLKVAKQRIQSQEEEIERLKST